MHIHIYVVDVSEYINILEFFGKEKDFVRRWPPLDDLPVEELLGRPERGMTYRRSTERV